MRVSRLASAAAVAVMLTAPVLVSASDSDKSKTSEPASSITSESRPVSVLATLKAVKAAPMSSSELDAVKGQHAHFWNPGHPLPGEPQVVNRNNTDHWLDLGNEEIVGPGYHGLCKAQAVSPAIFINPGGGC